MQTIVSSKDKGNGDETLEIMNDMNQCFCLKICECFNGIFTGYESLGSCLIKDKSGRGLASTIINYLERVKVDFRAIKVLGSDGTNAITGYEVKPLPID